MMRLKLPALVLVCDRTGISDRSDSTIVILQDVGFISVNTKDKIIDRMKVHREKVKKRNELQKLRNKIVLGLYFDG